MPIRFSTVIGDISDALKIPPHFLGKVLQMLVRSRLVISQRGKAGGFVLGKASQDITPFDIIYTIDGPVFLDGCVLGFSDCNDEVPCPVHLEWKFIKSGTIHLCKLTNKIWEKEYICPEREKADIELA